MGKDHYRIYETTFSYRNESESASTWHYQYKHFVLLYRVLNMLRGEGFVIVNDKEIAKCIRKDHFIGSRGDLKLHAERFPAGFKIEFFQDINFENPNGGRYDFGKFQKMPYLIRLHYIKYVKMIAALVGKLADADDHTEIPYKTAEDRIKAKYVREWVHEQTDMNFNLSDLDGQTQETYNGTGRDGETLHNGDVKYFRHWNGYLYRGRIYHNINNMWWVIINKTEFHNVADFELFDLKPEDNRGRQKRPLLPKEYQERRAAIEATTTKELVNELRRREKRKETSA